MEKLYFSYTPTCKNCIEIIEFLDGELNLDLLELVESKYFEDQSGLVLVDDDGNGNEVVVELFATPSKIAAKLLDMGVINGLTSREVRNLSYKFLEQFPSKASAE